MSARLTGHLRNNIVGYVAVFIALSAGAYAAGLKRNSVKSKQIKDGAVASVDVGDDSLTGVDIRESTLEGVSGPPGSTGTQGATGPQGVQGPAGSPDTPAQLLAKLLGVDGGGSGMDADFVDGVSSGGLVKSGDAVAGADLSGTYPGPTIAAGAVGPDELAPVPAARVTSPTVDCVGAGINVPSGTETPVRWRDEEFDQGDLHVDACGTSEQTKLTAPRTGLYTIAAGMVWSPNSTGKRTVALRKNAAAYIAQEEYDAAGSGSTLQSMATVARLTAGDFVDVTIVQTSGGLLTAGAGDSRAHLAMAWLGP